MHIGGGPEWELSSEDENIRRLEQKSMASAIFGLGYADKRFRREIHCLRRLLQSGRHPPVEMMLQIHTRSTISGTANIKKVGY